VILPLPSHAVPLSIRQPVPDGISKNAGMDITLVVASSPVAVVRPLGMEISEAGIGYCESFNGKLRDECLNGEIFYSLKEAQVVIEQWRVQYNTRRPHSSLGYRPPAPQTILPKEMGYGDMENATRFPHLHTPDYDYEVTV
jgi:hypothetical protein